MSEESLQMTQLQLLCSSCACYPTPRDERQRCCERKMGWPSSSLIYRTRQLSKQSNHKGERCEIGWKVFFFFYKRGGCGSGGCSDQVVTTASNKSIFHSLKAPLPGLRRPHRVCVMAWLWESGDLTARLESTPRLITNIITFPWLVLFPPSVAQVW